MHRLVRRAVRARQAIVSRQYATDGLPQPRLDFRAIANNVVFKSHNAFNRRAAVPHGAVQNIARMYQEQKDLLSALNRKRSTRSDLEKQIKTGKDATERASVLQNAKALKFEISALEEQLSVLEDALLALALTLPNDTHPSSPIGPEAAAVVLSTHGPEPGPTDPAVDHVSIGLELSLFNFESAATTTGSSWYYLTNEGAILELALTNFAISVALRRGFQFLTAPDVVRAGIASRCGFQPRDASDPPVHQMYHLAQADGAASPELVLSGTAEVPLAAMFANRVIEQSALPVKLVGLGTAFRAEAGARGADTRGLYRVHQFRKLELFAVTTETASDAMMEEIKDVQLEIFTALQLPLRVLDMPTEELGASAYRKYDMEAWMPGRGAWGEISSTSNCTDYQARRLHTRYRPTHPSTSPDAPRLPFAHTLNGTAAAIPRLIIALIENGAQLRQEKSVLPLPSCLRPFWVGSFERIQWY